MAKKKRAKAKKALNRSAKAARASKRSTKAAKQSSKAPKRSTKGPRRSTKAAKRSTKTAGRKTAKRPASRTATKSGAKRVAKRAAKRSTKPVAAATASKPPRKAKKAPARTATKAPPQIAKAGLAARKAPAAGRKPNLDRERRTVREEDMVPSPPSSLDLDRSASSARTGRAEYEEKLRLHTSTSPAMTGGDVDANWEDAATVGDEAPGGDSPTPDQDIVDEIGKALGIEYDDDQELQGGDELAERDRHRWELDPASKDDVDEE